MKNYSFLLVILLVFNACLDKDIKNHNEIYIADRDFGSIENRISKLILDSLIINSGDMPLAEYKNQDPLVQKATDILVKELKTQQIDKEKLLISKVHKDNDSTITFEMSHVDYLVYIYNWKTKNEKLKEDRDADDYYSSIPPLTGNVSGFEGYYSVDLTNQTLEIDYFQ